jgi:hypothetical protein
MQAPPRGVAALPWGSGGLAASPLVNRPVLADPPLQDVPGDRLYVVFSSLSGMSPVAAVQQYVGCLRSKAGNAASDRGLMPAFALQPGSGDVLIAGVEDALHDAPSSRESKPILKQCIDSYLRIAIVWKSHYRVHDAWNLRQSMTIVGR